MNSRVEPLSKRSPLLGRLTAPTRSTAPAPLADSMGRIPAGTRVYDRVAYLVERARSKSVAHLGFVDARNMRVKVDRSAWLHAQLGSVTERLVGLDMDQTGVQTAR